MILKTDGRGNTNLDNFIHMYTTRVENKMTINNKVSKIKDNEIVIPPFNKYYMIPEYNYNLSQLKMLMKHYKLKQTGNKTQLTLRIYVYLYLSFYIVNIQKKFRGHLQRKCNLLRGPAFRKRSLCTNANDFVTFEPIEKIYFQQFICFKDIDGFIYGFDIASLYNLYLTGSHYNNIKNPYNRSIIPSYVFDNIKKILTISKLLKTTIKLNIDDDIDTLSDKQNLELRCLTLFQNIDALGNYSNSSWFNSLNNSMLIKFLRELIDIWNYRAQLSNYVKSQIYPPTGEPFYGMNINYIVNIQDNNLMKTKILDVLERIVNSGVNNDYKSLGAYYVLSALTLVNEDAANSIPWLYQSVAYN
jgi:hypothetical protein